MTQTKNIYSVLVCWFLVCWFQQFWSVDAERRMRLIELDPEKNQEAASVCWLQALHLCQAWSELQYWITLWLWQKRIKKKIKGSTKLEEKWTVFHGGHLQLSTHTRLNRTWGLKLNCYEMLMNLTHLCLSTHLCRKVRSTCRSVYFLPGTFTIRSWDQKSAADHFFSKRSEPCGIDQNHWFVPNQISDSDYCNFYVVWKLR